MDLTAMNLTTEDAKKMRQAMIDSSEPLNGQQYADQMQHIVEQLQDVERRAITVNHDNALLKDEIEHLKSAAGNAASILSKYLSHQYSHADSYVHLKKARDGLVSLLVSDA